MQSAATTTTTGAAIASPAVATAAAAAAAATSSPRMATSSLPPRDILAWMLTVVGQGQEDKLVHLQTAGLTCFTVKELKRIWMTLSQLLVTRAVVGPKIGAVTGNKSNMVSKLLVYVQDPAVQSAIRHDASVRQSTKTTTPQLTKSTSTPAPPQRFNTNPAAPALADIPWAAAAYGDPNMLHTLWLQQAQQQQQQHQPYHHFHANAQQQQQQQPHPLFTRTHVSAALSQQQQQQQQQQQHGNQLHGVAAAPHPPADPAVTPQPGTREGPLLAELLQMGFTDRHECLTVIRGALAKQNAATTTADTLMLELVQRREEMDEARKMDQARLASEQALRQEQASRRRATAARERQEALAAASLQEWQGQHFAHSWLLQSAQVRQALERALQREQAADSGGGPPFLDEKEDDQVDVVEDDDEDDTCSTNNKNNNNKAQPIKNALLQLLQHEKKSRQWYGPHIPSAWFVAECGTRLHKAAADPQFLLATLQSLTDRLKSALFELSEQEGNVPVLFTSAFKEHGDCNNTTAAATNGATVAREVVSAGHTADEPICID